MTFKNIFKLKISNKNTNSQKTFPENSPSKEVPKIIVTSPEGSIKLMDQNHDKENISNSSTKSTSAELKTPPVKEANGYSAHNCELPVPTHSSSSSPVSQCEVKRSTGSPLPPLELSSNTTEEENMLMYDIYSINPGECTPKKPKSNEYLREDVINTLHKHPRRSSCFSDIECMDFPTILSESLTSSPSRSLKILGNRIGFKNIDPTVDKDTRHRDKKKSPVRKKRVSLPAVLDSKQFYRPVYNHNELRNLKDFNSRYFENLSPRPFSSQEQNFRTSNDFLKTANLETLEQKYLNTISSESKDSLTDTESETSSQDRGRELDTSLNEPEHISPSNNAVQDLSFEDEDENEEEYFTDTNTNDENEYEDNTKLSSGLSNDHSHDKDTPDAQVQLSVKDPDIKETPDAQAIQSVKNSDIKETPDAQATQSGKDSDIKEAPDNQAIKSVKDSDIKETPDAQATQSDKDSDIKESLDAQVRLSVKNPKEKFKLSIKSQKNIRKFKSLNDLTGKSKFEKRNESLPFRKWVSLSLSRFPNISFEPLKNILRGENTFESKQEHTSKENSPNATDVTESKEESAEIQEYDREYFDKIIDESYKGIHVCLSSPDLESDAEYDKKFEIREDAESKSATEEKVEETTIPKSENIEFEKPKVIPRKKIIPKLTKNFRTLSLDSYRSRTPSPISMTALKNDSVAEKTEESPKKSIWIKRNLFGRSSLQDRTKPNFKKSLSLSPSNRRKFPFFKSAEDKEPQSDAAKKEDQLKSKSLKKVNIIDESDEVHFENSNNVSYTSERCSSSACSPIDYLLENNVEQHLKLGLVTQEDIELYEWKRATGMSPICDINWTRETLRKNKIIKCPSRSSLQSEGSTHFDSDPRPFLDDQNIRQLASASNLDEDSLSEEEPLSFAIDRVKPSNSNKPGTKYTANRQPFLQGKFVDVSLSDHDVKSAKSYTGMDYPDSQQRSQFKLPVRKETGLPTLQALSPSRPPRSKLTGHFAFSGFKLGKKGPKSPKKGISIIGQVAPPDVKAFCSLPRNSIPQDNTQEIVPGRDRSCTLPLCLRGNGNRPWDEDGAYQNPKNSKMGRKSPSQLSIFQGMGKDNHFFDLDKVKNNLPKFLFDGKKAVKSSSGSTSPSVTSPKRKKTSENKAKISRFLGKEKVPPCDTDVPAYALFLRAGIPSHKSDSHIEDEDGGVLRKLNDMRQRLGFLKKRHDGGSSVRPHPDEVLTWAEDFNNLMASKYGQSLFKAFLQREFSEENVEFWLAVEDYKNTRTGKLHSKACKIHNDYVAVQSPKEINLDSATRSQITARLESPDKNMFDAAQKRVQALMESDAYLRFLQSELYKELLHPDQDSNEDSS